MRHTLVIAGKPGPRPSIRMAGRKPLDVAALACAVGLAGWGLARLAASEPDFAMAALWAAPCLVVVAAVLRQASLRGLHRSL